MVDHSWVGSNCLIYISHRESGFAPELDELHIKNVLSSLQDPRHVCLSRLAARCPPSISLKAAVTLHLLVFYTLFVSTEAPLSTWQSLPAAELFEIWRKYFLTRLAGLRFSSGYKPAGFLSLWLAAGIS